MAREHQINEDPTLPVKVVALSIIGLWVAYFLLTTLRGFILSYELQQAFGLDLQQEMLWRRAVVCMGGVAAYGLWRMTRRASVPVDATGAYAYVAPTSSPVMVEAAQEYVIDQANSDEKTAETGPDDDTSRTNT